MRLILQLINEISKVLQNLLRYFNAIDILTSFTLSAAGFFLVILILDLNDLLFSNTAVDLSL